MSREPLAALVAEVRDWLEGGARPESLSSGLRRLLAAVEAGTKCADALQGLDMGCEVDTDIDASEWGCPICRGLRADTNPIPHGFRIGHALDCPVNAALDGWAKVAGAPASHGSPEQGR